MGAVFGYTRLEGGDRVAKHEVYALERAGSTSVYIEQGLCDGECGSAFRDLIVDCTPGDVICVMHLSRFGHSLDAIVRAVSEILRAGVELKSLGDGIDTCSSSKSGIISAFMALDEATTHVPNDGSRRSCKETNAIPRKVGRPSLPAARRSYAEWLLENGTPVQDIARRIGCSTATIHRIAAAAKKYGD